MTTTDTPAAVRLDLQKLTNILDAANSTWTLVRSAADPDERMDLLRIHVKQLRQYLDTLDTFLDETHDAE